MDVATAVGSVFAAFGLSGAAGLNAWIPLFVTGLVARSGAIDLEAPYDQLSSTAVLVVVGALLALDFVGDKVPVIDSILHTAGVVIAPVAGAIVFAAPTGLETDIPPVVALLAGALISGSLHAGRAGVRPVSTTTTAGAGNPVLSLAEDVGSTGLTALAFLVPVLAFLLVVGALGVLVLAWRRLRRRLPPAQT